MKSNNNIRGCPIMDTLQAINVLFCIRKYYFLIHTEMLMDEYMVSRNVTYEGVFLNFFLRKERRAECF